jgi:hypothetical protein
LTRRTHKNKHTNKEIRTIRAIQLLTVICAWFGACSAFAAISVDPQNPTSADAITVTVTGPIANVCSGDSANHSIVGGLITVSVQTVSICFGVPRAYDIDIAIGQLQPGNYTVEHFEPGIDPGDPPILVGTQQFVVSAAPIPTLNPPGIVMMAIVLGYAAVLVPLQRPGTRTPRK